MDAQIQPEINKGPDFQKIYSEIIEIYHPEKKKECSFYLNRTDWSSLDVITVNNIIFAQKSSKESFAFNQNHRAYDEKTILQILQYQKQHKLNDAQVSLHFKLSRNTLLKWKKKCVKKHGLFHKRYKSFHSRFNSKEQ